MPSPEMRVHTEDPRDQEHLDAIAAFVRDHQLTEDELSAAYQIALVPEEGESGSLREEVHQLAADIRQWADEGLPLNRAGELIRSLRAHGNEALPRPRLTTLDQMQPETINDEDRRVYKIQRFVMENDITNEEFRIAYELSGMPARERAGTGARQGVQELAALLDTCMGEGMTVQSILRIIDMHEMVEAMPQYYADLVNTLHVTDDERLLLSEIVEHRKAGTLLVAVRNTGEILDEFDIPRDVRHSRYPQSYLAAQIRDRLLPFAGLPLVISFTESK